MGMNFCFSSFCTVMFSKLSSHPCRGICDVSHLPLSRDHPAEGYSSLFPAVWDVPLPLLRRQHQDRFPGCDGQEGAAPRQSQLKAIKKGSPSSLGLIFPLRRTEAGVGRLLDLLKDSLNRTAGGFGCCLVVSWPDPTGSERVSKDDRWGSGTW